MRTLLLALTLLSACDALKPKVVTQIQVDNAMAKGDYEIVCIGLKMVKNDELRTYTAQQLAGVPSEIADKCLCEALQPKEDGTWDEAVATGLRGSAEDSKVTCLADLVKRPELAEREKALGLLARTKAPVARTTIADLATGQGDPAIRAAALRNMSGDKTVQDSLVKLMQTDPDADVRAGAAWALGGLARADASLVAPLSAVASGDAEGAVRAAALYSARQNPDRAAADLACKLMLSDPDEGVRKAAVSSFKGTKDAADLACLRKRMLTEEESSEVRLAMLEVVKGSPSAESGKILCDSIPFWLKTYLKQGLPENVPGTDIIRAQNDRDWENSFACVKKSLGGSGYSCYARQYSAYWMNELGGTASVPKCAPTNGG